MGATPPPLLQPPSLRRRRRHPWRWLAAVAALSFALVCVQVLLYGEEASSITALEDVVDEGVTLVRGFLGDGPPAPDAWRTGCKARPDRGRVFLSYAAPNGLASQLSGHVSALSIAHAAGLDGVLLPPAWSQDPLAGGAGQDGRFGTEAPLSGILDVEAMRREWAWRGLQLVEVGSQEGANLTARCSRVEAANGGHAQPFGSALWGVRSAVIDARRRHGHEACLILDRGTPYQSLRHKTTSNFTFNSARSLAFNSTIEALAEEVAAAVGGPFNGGDIWVEADAGAGLEGALPQYIHQMRRLGFNASLPLYAAPGLLAQRDTGAFRRMEGNLTAAGVCSRVLAKESVLTPERLAGLHPEQLALVDLLVLTRSALFVGHRSSAFSHVARDLRAVRAVRILEARAAAAAAAARRRAEAIAAEAADAAAFAAARAAGGSAAAGDGSGSGGGGSLASGAAAVDWNVLESMGGADSSSPPAPEWFDSGIHLFNSSTAVLLRPGPGGVALDDVARLAPN